MNLSVQEVRESKAMSCYFNFAANALLPVYSGAADALLAIKKPEIIEVAQSLLDKIDYSPATIYRGIILKEGGLTTLAPSKPMQYLSFTTKLNVAEHFANCNGFGSDLFDVTKQLGEYGYIIEYTPERQEILFHYDFLSLLPFAEAFSLMGLDGAAEIEGLKKQHEVMIVQPDAPLVVRPFFANCQTAI